MEILENREEWQVKFEAGWLNHYRETGGSNWKLYNIPRNRTAPSGPGIDLSKSRIMFISSAGGYLKGNQAPFDAANALGDYTVRILPTNTPPEKFGFSHDHYDHTAVDIDHQVLLPLGHLRDLVKEGTIGELAPSVVSFMGYQPVATRVIDEVLPAILERSQVEQIDAAFLVPS